jgi:hypothetical protein
MTLGETQLIAYALSAGAAFTISSATYTVYDAADNTVDSGTPDIVAPGTAAQELQWQFAPSVVGTYRVKYVVTLNDGQVQQYQASITVTPALPSVPTAEQWARFAISGDIDAATPTDATLAPFVALAEAEAIATYPCVADEDGLLTLTASTGLGAWNQYIGYMAAYERQQNPATAGSYNASEERVKVGPVERVVKSSSGTTTTDPSANYRRMANLARLRVPCIREGIVARNTGAEPLFAASGRRREIGDSLSVPGIVLGVGEDGNVHV